MKRENVRLTNGPQTPGPNRGLKAVYRAAVALALALVAVIAVGSLYAIARPADSAPLFRIGGPNVAAPGAAHGSGPADFSGGGDNVFTGIGRLRIPLMGQPPATVVLSLSFPYPADDRFFAEELATRVGEFRSIAVGYFSSLRRDEIAGLNEAAAKNEILARYNALLHLGRIETLYFTDLIILD